MSSPEKYILGLAAVGLCFLIAAKHKGEDFRMPAMVAQATEQVSPKNSMHKICTIEVRDQSLGELSNEYVNTMCNCVTKYMTQGMLVQLAETDPETAWGAAKNVCRYEYNNGGLYPFMQKYSN